MLARLLLALITLCCAANAQADVFRPAYLEMRESGPNRYDVMWKVPTQGDLRLGVKVLFPPDTVQLTPPQGLFTGNAYIERWQIARPGGFAGQSLRIDGIASGVSDVIVRIEHADGTSQVERLLPQRPQFTVAAATSTGMVAWSYLVLGVEHILGGIDHLLFVLALLLLVDGVKRLILTITAFTIAHSITLGAATLGIVQVPGAPVEAVIALSILFLASELARRPVDGSPAAPDLTSRYPWIVAFSFGLLHGFGFAGALADVGLPERAIPLALLFFNVGVELGQLIFIGIVLLIGRLVSRAAVPVPIAWPRYVAYAVGSLAAFWVFERTLGAF